MPAPRAPLEQPLQAQADAEQRHAAGDGAVIVAAPLVVQDRGRVEVADAGHDDGRAAVEIAGRTGVKSSAPTAAKPLRTEVRLPAP